MRGIEGLPITVEVDIANGLPAFTIVGLPDGSIRESKDRVKAAIKNSGYQFPTRRITVNLAPADVRKDGTAFDLPIAMGLLVATKVVPQESVTNKMFVGELSLDGTIRSVPGILPMALGAEDNSIETIIVPSTDVEIASLTKNVQVIPVSHLHQLVDWLNDQRTLEPYSPPQLQSNRPEYELGFEDIRGQASAKRALEIAAAGMHNILLKGPPGTGKTLLARSVPSILPELDYSETVDTARIYCVSGEHGSGNSTFMRKRPFRAPHHTISDAGLIGGGTIPRPGEVSLAHNGVLFLDELPEFRRNVLEVLRQPLEDGYVSIARAQRTLSFPARFMLIAAMNPCPCGYNGSALRDCNCNDLQIQRYQSKISGPLLDRMDIYLEVGDRRPQEDTSEVRERSSVIRDRVQRARNTQTHRYKSFPKLNVNGSMTIKEIERFCKVGSKTQSLLEKSIQQLGLSTRGYHRILKLSRTIADLDASETISLSHVAEAIGYRRGEYRNEL